MEALCAVPRPRIDRSWWAGVGLIVFVGALFRFTGFLVSLPYFEHADEPWLFYEAAYQRGLINEWLHPNPSPGLIAIFQLAQVTTERITGDSSLDHAANILAAMRFVSNIVSLTTLVLVALTGRELAGKKAGWLAELVWALIPLVIYHSFIAIAEPWMMLCAALSLFAALRALNTRRRGWAVLSVWAGLIGFAFKYSMFPFPGLGLVVCLWFLWSDRPRRAYWVRALVIQSISIGAFLLFLIVFAGLGDTLSAPTREVGVFFSNPLERLQDGALAAQIFGTAFHQLGTTAIVFWTVFAFALLILIRTRQPLSRVLVWLLLGAFGSGLALLIATYYYVPNTMQRYLFAANMSFMLIGSASLVVLYEFLTSRIHSRAARAVLGSASAVALVVWLAPLAIQAAQDAYRRTLPQTLTDMTIWASNTLGEGAVLTDTLGSAAFSREWGGYAGPFRKQAFDQDILSRTPDEWLAEGYRYLQILEADEQRLVQDEDGKRFFGQLLELRRFPPPESVQIWNGPTFLVYQLQQPTLALDTVFGDTFHLIGCDCGVDNARAGETIALRLYWRALQTPTRNYSVFIHFYPLNAVELLAQVDSTPGPARRPTMTWVLTSEVLVSEPLSLTLPLDLESGQYRLVAGIYDAETSERLRVGDRDHFVLRTITIG